MFMECVLFCKYVIYPLMCIPALYDIDPRAMGIMTTLLFTNLTIDIIMVCLVKLLPRVSAMAPNKRVQQRQRLIINSQRNIIRLQERLRVLNNRKIMNAIIRPRPLRDEVCPICLEHVGAVGLVLHCGHVFHRDCVYPWFTQNTTCPACRRVSITGLLIHGTSEAQFLTWWTTNRVTCSWKSGQMTYWTWGRWSPDGFCVIVRNGRWDCFTHGWAWPRNHCIGFDSLGLVTRDKTMFCFCLSP